MHETPDKVLTREKLMTLSADVVLVNGNVITMNPKQPRGEAVAVKGGKIIGIGRNSEMKQYCNPRTERLDLKGKILLPGFVESHNHMLTYASALLGIDLSIDKNKSIDDILARVKEKAATLPDGSWIEGRGKVNYINIRNDFLTQFT